MKKKYVTPTVEFEYYELNTSIAANCTVEINVGPGDSNHTQCDKWGGDWGDGDRMLLTGPVEGKPFYDDNLTDCNCYYSSGNKGYFTS